MSVKPVFLPTRQVGGEIWKRGFMKERPVRVGLDAISRRPIMRPSPG